MNNAASVKTPLLTNEMLNRNLLAVIIIIIRLSNINQINNETSVILCIICNLHSRHNNGTPITSSSPTSFPVPFAVVIAPYDFTEVLDMYIWP